MKQWKTVHAMNEAKGLLEKSLDVGYVTICRWSDTGFSPMAQEGWIANELRLEGKRGVYCFLKGTENTRALNHKSGSWYCDTLYHEAEVSIETEIKAPLYDNYRQWITIEEYMVYFLEIMAQHHYASWEEVGLCNGIFIPERATIDNINRKPQPKWHHVVSADKGLALRVS